MSSQWEYKIVEYRVRTQFEENKMSRQEAMNALGQQGWELIHISNDKDSLGYCEYTFKRKACLKVLE